MIEHKDFVFVEVPKTATTTLHKWLAENVKGTWSRGRKHRSIREIIPDDRFKFGGVRNPFDWYVSLWESTKNLKGDAINEFTQNPFKEAVMSMNNPKHKKIGRLVRGEDLQEGEIGLFTAHFFNICCTEGNISSCAMDYVYKMENLAELFEVTKGIINWGEVGHLYKSERKPWRGYYDRELFDFVYEKEKIIIEEFGYEDSLHM